MNQALCWPVRNVTLFEDLKEDLFHQISSE